MDRSDRGQCSDLVRWAGLMNGSRIEPYVTAGSRNLSTGIALSEQSLLHALHSQDTAGMHNWQGIC